MMGMNAGRTMGMNAGRTEEAGDMLRPCARDLGE